MQYMLDTIDKQEILYCIQTMPVSGVTSNPTIIKRQGKIDFFPYFRELRGILGPHRSLHIQVTAPDADGMMREAETIQEKIDAQAFIKVPVNEAGLEVIARMKRRTFRSPQPGSIQKRRLIWRLKPEPIFSPCITTAWKHWTSMLLTLLRQSPR